MSIPTNIDPFSLRIAEVRDVPLILDFIKKLARLALERDCGRLEWAVLDWNESAMEFYKSLGAVLLNEWIVNRVTGESLVKMAEEY